MHRPSDRLVPEFIAENDSLYNLATTDWKENAAFENTSNTTLKQLVSFAMIAAYMYLGGSVLADGVMEPLGVATLAAATSSLTGYFGLGSAPIAKFLRTNMMNVGCAAMAIGSLFSSGINVHIMLLAALHMFDSYIGAQQETTRARENFDSEFQR